jgi:small multidrug resistance family-3 protein
MLIIKSLFVFILAELFEIGGGYLVWLWLKEDKPWWLGLIGFVTLALCGVVATWQPAAFGGYMLLMGKYLSLWQ